MGRSSFFSTFGVLFGGVEGVEVLPDFHISRLRFPNGDCCAVMQIPAQQSLAANILNLQYRRNEVFTSAAVMPKRHTRKQSSFRVTILADKSIPIV
jgi:hypothetical protein